MQDLDLVKPSEEHEPAVLEFRDEFFANGELVINGGALLEQIESYSDWLSLIRGDRGISELAKDLVGDSVFLAVRKTDGRIVGIIRIAHELNDFLRQYGGNIGYSVRPSERQNGYATKMLQLGKEFCRTLGLDKVMLGCYKDNIASQKVIIKCGGVLDREQLYVDGKPQLVYWITL